MRCGSPFLVVLTLHSFARHVTEDPGDPCDAVGICQCQSQCSINGFWMADGHPNCNLSLDGNPADVMDADGSAELQAALDANEAQGICDFLQCKLDCLQHCRVQLQSVVEQCENIRSLVPTCGVDCAAQTSSRELAVCLVGQLRGICKAEDFSSLFNVALSNFESVDVYLVFPDTSCKQDVALFKEAASIFHHNDLRTFPLCQRDELTPAELDFEDWFQNHEWWAKHWHAKGYGGNNQTAALRRLMLANKHVTACAKEVSSRATDYRFVSRLRPDVEWVSFVDRKSLEMSVPGRVLANFVAMPIQGVVEDTFSIGAPEDMKKYFSFYEKQTLDVTNLEQTNSPWCVAHATLREATHCKKIFPENLLEEHLRRQQLQLQKRQDICFERLAPCMQQRNHYCTRYKQHPRGYSQSHSKAFLEGDRDFFLTASGSYADYDTVLAARFVHFFLSEAIRLGHPPRIIDMGCGRGSYVEVFKSWGLPVMGIDGNTVITRSVRVNSFLWDLTEPLDLKTAFEGKTCHFYLIDHHSQAEKEYVKQVVSVLGKGALHLYMFAMVPRIDATHFWASRHPDGHPEEVLMNQAEMANYLRSLCCADERCAAFAFTEGGGALLAWAPANSTAEKDFDPQGGNVWYQATGEPLVNTSDIFDIGGPGDFATFKMQYAEMEVSFSIADWVVSLGVGAEIPRMGEKVFVANLVRHAEQGVIIRWGSQGQNPRSVEEVLKIFQDHGFELDEAATSSLKFFSGLVHAPERDDLLVLRRLSADLQDSTPQSDADLQLIDEWGGDRCSFAGELQHGLQGARSQYGPLGPGRMWVSGNCVGLFRAGNSGEPVLCSSQHKKFQECTLPGLTHHQMAFDAEPGPEMDSLEASALYDLADHMVPMKGIWLGDVRLNLVFFKIARAIAAPFRWKQLRSAWSWFWSTSWPILFAQPPEPHRVFIPWTKTVERGIPVWQIGRVILALQQLSCRLRRETSEGKVFPSERVLEKLEELERGYSNEVTSPERLVESLADVQREVNISVQGFTMQEVLLDPVFSDEILPRLWAVLSSESPDGTGGLGLIDRQAGCKDPVWDEPVNLASLWDKETATGWYLYRLAALDPTM